MAAALTFQDIGRIVNKFDHTHFDTPTPSNGIAKEYATVHFGLLASESIFPIEVIDGIAKQYLASKPSVGNLLMLYRGAPSLPNYSLRDSPAERFLNGSAKDLLIKANLVPSQERGDLVHFKQLMNEVFCEYFQSLNHEQKLDILKKFQENYWEQKSPEEKLNTLQTLQAYLYPDQSILSRAKVKLQFYSWKVQLVVGRVFQNGIFQVCFQVAIFGASAYGAWRLYSLRDTMTDGITFLMTKLFEIALGPDAMTRKDVGIWDAVKLGGLIVSLVGFSVYASIKVSFLVLSYGNNVPWVLTYPVLGIKLLAKFIQSPLGTVVEIPFQVTQYANQRGFEISKLMDGIAIQNSQQQYINAFFPDLLGKWQQVVLNPPALPRAIQ